MTKTVIQINSIKISLGFITLFLFSCGLFIKRPIFIEKPFVQNNLKESSFFCYQDQSCNFIDYRINLNSEQIIIAIHGLGAHAASFSFLQEYLDKERVSSLALDLRGFGHWSEKKGDLKNIGLHLEDLHEVIQNIRIRHPMKKIVLLGESLGSSLALWYAIEHPKNIDGLILTSLVTSSGSNDVEFKTLLNLLIGYLFNPTYPVKLDYNPNIYSNDSSFVDWAYNKDTLGTRSISTRYLVQANRVIKESHKQICKLDIPILLMQGGKDVLSSKEKLERILAKCGTSSHIEYNYYPEMLHSIVNDSKRNIAFKKISQWIKTINFSH